MKFNDGRSFVFEASLLCVSETNSNCHLNFICNKIGLARSNF